MFHNFPRKTIGARVATWFWAAALILAAAPGTSRAQAPQRPAARTASDKLREAFGGDIQPLFRKYCFGCHSGDLTEADLDFGAFPSFESVRRNIPVWQKVGEMLESGQMPPKKAKKPSDAEQRALQNWVHGLLIAEAAAHAGDPGPVILRRLDNVEYAWTIRDLTGIMSLDPAQEFPADGAAGEGFTNTGNALAMSPPLVTKYLAAAKGVADHVVLLPDGFRFSPRTSRRDWTDECLKRIRDFYAQFSASGGGANVNVQGLEFHTNKGGLLPVQQYLVATIAARSNPRGNVSIDQLAAQHHLSARYLAKLYDVMLGESAESRSLLIAQVRERWKSAKPEDVASIASEIEKWQKALWTFNLIGHIGRRLGRKDGPSSWMEPRTPLVARQDFRIKLSPSEGQKSLTLYLSAGDAGDGNKHDFVLWENPRLVAPGRPDLALRDVRAFVAELDRKRGQIDSTIARCLEAANAASGVSDRASISQLADRFGLDPVILTAWLEYLGIAAGQARIETLLANQVHKAESYDFVNGWAAEDALSVVANSSDQHVRIPGNLKPHGIAVHPAPSRSVVVGWRSPVAEAVTLKGSVQHAHPECGNGVTWTVELRRGKTRQRLAGGRAQGGGVVGFGPFTDLAVNKGDLIALLIGPRDGNHSCDLTAVELNLKAPKQEWDLARDVSPNILAGNPHADSANHPGVWNFGSEPDRGGSPWIIPSGSLLARWQAAKTGEERRKLARDLESLVKNGSSRLPKDSPDLALYHQLTSLAGPLLSAVRSSIASRNSEPEVPGVREARGGRASRRADIVGGSTGAAPSQLGLAPSAFGIDPSGQAVDERSLCVQAPATIAVNLPSELVDGCEFVTTGTLHPAMRREGSAQLKVQTSPAAFHGLDPATPVVVADGSAARARFETAFRDVRALFPPVLCYSQIVPVDEAVTLNLFYREDDHLRRLMLDSQQIAHLDRLWDELLYISQEPLLLATAFEQIAEFATQDRPDMVQSLAPMRGPMKAYAGRFRQRLVETEKPQFQALLAFAARAYRRPLTDSEAKLLSNLYQNLRKEGAPHDEAFRLTLARTLVAPAFLYRIEHPQKSTVQHPVSSYEMASRLSYFLWSSTPDDELLRLASQNRLQEPAVLQSQTHRMLRDEKIRRLATEFGAQWLHLRDFDQLDEKSERHFPTFAALRGAMYEESLRFLTDLFQNDRPLLNLLDCDYTFLNEALANHYGIPGVRGATWRRVAGTRKYQRGGILTLASTLAKQSGASRTSPILRGNWLSEVILGEKLPRPPKNVPQLPETAPEGLTERQLIERHSTEPACAKCHARIDPLGFALENFDAIGRFRERDAAGLAIDANTKLQDGTKLNGIDGLRDYLAKDRREAFIRQFNRKLLGFALGRSIQLSDEPLLDEMKAALEKNDYHVWAAIEAVVLSRQFRDLRGQDQSDDE
jgi:hypothetical protein